MSRRNNTGFISIQNIELTVQLNESKRLDLRGMTERQIVVI